MRTYIWDDGYQPIAQIDNIAGIERITYLHTDPIGSPVLGTDSTGKIVWKASADPFGAGAPNEDADGDGTRATVNLRMPGQYYDSESNLHENGQRYYDPMVGRYLTSDTVGLRGGANTYSYVANNPLRWIDPMGLWSVTAGGYIGVGGQIMFGNDGGNGFLTGRFGFGLGGGISYNPTGGIPGPAPQDPTQGGVVLSCSAKANFSAGPLQTYLEGGPARNYSNEESSIYSGKGFSFRNSFTGLDASGSFGGQFTIYSGRR